MGGQELEFGDQNNGISLEPALEVILSTPLPPPETPVAHSLMLGKLFPVVWDPNLRPSLGMGSSPTTSQVGNPLQSSLSRLLFCPWSMDSNTQSTCPG